MYYLQEPVFLLPNHLNFNLDCPGGPDLHIFTQWKEEPRDICDHGANKVTFRNWCTSLLKMSIGGPSSCPCVCVCQKNCPQNQTPGRHFGLRNLRIFPHFGKLVPTSCRVFLVFLMRLGVRKQPTRHGIFAHSECRVLRYGRRTFGGWGGRWMGWD